MHFGAFHIFQHLQQLQRSTHSAGAVVKKKKKTIYLGKNPKSKRQMVNISSEALTLTTD